MREIVEAEEIEGAKEESSRVAAFFDVDGTLLALPSLERSFIRMLRSRRAIPIKNYFLWVGEAMRLLLCGMAAAFEGNKMYLRGVQSFDERGTRGAANSSGHKSRYQVEGQASVPASKRASRKVQHNPRLPAPAFFSQAIEKISWHAERGHRIVLVSGTLEPLAKDAARAVEAELAARGVIVKIHVCATRLEEVDCRWTGQILGEAMFGGAKARVVERLAKDMRLDLMRCYAYGDSLSDRALLEAVGQPTAVNPSRKLRSIAQKRAWLVVDWNHGRNLSPSAQSSPRKECEDEIVAELRGETGSGRSMSNVPIREAKSRSLG